MKIDRYVVFFEGQTTESLRNLKKQSIKNNELVKQKKFPSMVQIDDKKDT